MTRREVQKALDEHAMGDDRLRGLTVRQPWATLIAGGDKTIELRTMRTNWRGLVLIHAGQSPEDDFEPRDADAWPLGCTVAIARVVDCRRLGFGDGDAAGVDAAWWREAWQDPSTWIDDVWGWVLRDVTVLPHCPMRGRQGLWIPTAEECWRLDYEVAAA